MKTFTKFLSLCIIAITLSSCKTLDGVRSDFNNINWPNFNATSSNTQNASFLKGGDCPQIEIVDELSILSEFKNSNATDQNNLVSSVSMTQSENSCEYGTQSVTIDLTLQFNGELGPQGRKNASDTPFMSHPFFVAVVSSSGQILAKEVFAAPLTYDAGKNTQTYLENLRQIIPINSKGEGKNLKIMTGFQLTAEQLAYNRQLIKDDIIARKAAEKAAKNAPEETQAIKIETQQDAQQTTETIIIEKPTITERAGPIDITIP